MKHRIYVVGMGPGQENMMTQEAMQVLEASDVIIGYTVYLKLLGERFGCKDLLTAVKFFKLLIGKSRHAYIKSADRVIWTVIAAAPVS